MKTISRYTTTNDNGVTMVADNNTGITYKLQEDGTMVALRKASLGLWVSIGKLRNADVSVWTYVMNLLMAFRA